MSLPQKNLSLGRNIKIGSFHLGSTMADVLGAGIWNRVMKDAGFAATPIGLLLALRYFLVPLAIWSGRRSDQSGWRGYRRLPWVWSGRLMMIAGYLLLAFATVELLALGEVTYSSIWWLGIVAGFLISSTGYAISGSTFLALVYDRAPEAQRGRAVGVVWTFLIAGYPVAGILFSRLLPSYEARSFMQLFVLASAAMLAIWGFALWREEQAQAQASPAPQESASLDSMWADVREVWQYGNVRYLAAFILLSFLAGFMQDALLEPFGGRVFGMSVGETTRFQAFWGTTAILSSIAALWGYRRWAGLGYRRFAQGGVWVMTITFLLLTWAALQASEGIVRPALLLLGLGYGFWNIGTLGMMVENSRAAKAGLDLGIWTVITTLCRGGAVLSGTLLFDLGYWLTDNAPTAYGAVFLLEALLLLLALWVLHRMPSHQPKLSASEQDQELVLSMSMD